jgi:FkbM family methyltransferase
MKSYEQLKAEMEQLEKEMAEAKKLEHAEEADKIEIAPQQLINLFVQFYEKHLFEPSLASLNEWLLNTSLNARGYSNFRNQFETGEDFFISEILAPEKPKLCIDIGANIGSYTKTLLNKTNATVISFEPLPTAFQELTAQTAAFGDRVIIENLGVSDKNTNLTIHYSPSALAHASFSEDVKKVPYVSNEMQADVAVVTLDSYCSTNSIDVIDFIKIDTEGYEAEVFRGASETFKKYQPKYIQIEFNWHQLFRNTSLNYFSELLPNYDVYQLVPNGWAKRDPMDPLSNIYQFSNFVFVRR